MYGPPGQPDPAFSGAGAKNLGPEHLEALRPYVVNLTLGEFSDDGIMQTSREDVDAIFDVHLPAFIDRAERRGATGPVPLVFWAHGGVVSERAGLNIAANQVPWWLDNGAYPIHFVWETGFVETLKQLVGFRRGRESAVPTVAVPTAAVPTPVVPTPAAGGTGHGPELESGPAGWGLWSAVKESAARASRPGGGARYLGERLAQFCADNHGRISLHAAGHSAGAIFHSHFIPAARAAGAPSFSTLQLLAPALRVDGFRSHLLPMVDMDINKITVYTMNMQAENDDNCFQIYRKSLLYMVSQIFEPEDDAPILGLEQSIRNDPELLVAFGLTPGVPGRVEVVWSPTDGAARPDSRSSATSHGGFDNDLDTMNSVARRILRRADIVEFSAQGHSLAADMEGAMAAPPGWADAAAAPVPDSGSAVSPVSDQARKVSATAGG